MNTEAEPITLVDTMVEARRERAGTLDFLRTWPLRAVGAEVVATFGLVLFGCGAVVINGATGGAVTHAGVCIAFGLAVMVMIYTTGHLSGAHMNPAVTIAFALAGRFPRAHVLPYVIAQVVGAIGASVVLYALFGNIAGLGATVPAGAVAQSFVLEVVLTFFLMFVVCGAATDARAQGAFAGVAIGAAVTIAALFGGPVSGASMNPARTLGPGLVSGHLDHLWIYLVAPVAGACLGALVYDALRGSEGEAK